ncbi:MAG TPA: erythromycin esterase family protein [Thermoanaerobaculia bacterium]
MNALLLVLIAAATAAGDPLPPDVKDTDRVRWLADHSLPIRSIDPKDEDFSDLQPLVSRIGNARVVQLGEATHGDGSTFLAKARLVKFLHEVMGFDVLAWEAGIFDVRRVDAALRSDMPLAEVGTQGLYGIWSRSAEVQPTLAYVRSTWSTPRPIETVGFDCRISTPENRKERFPSYVFAFFDRLDPKLISPQERADLTAMSVGLVPAEYYEKPGERNYNRALPKRLVAVIDERRSDLLAHHSAREIDYVRQILVSLMSMDRALPGQMTNATADGYTRDTAMAENLLWHLNGPLKDRKVIVWAHNYHILKDIHARVAKERAAGSGRPYTGPMGKFLDAALGREMVTVAFLSHHGRYAYVGEPPEDIPAVAPDSLEELLHATGRPLLLLDLRSAPEGHWLREPVTASFYMYEPIPTDWPRLYDLVFFIDEQKPSTKVP